MTSSYIVDIIFTFRYIFILRRILLQAYFEENPKDLKSLRHDKALHTVKLQDHLTDVPDYIIPSSLKDVISVESITKPNSGKLKFKKGRNKAFQKYMVCIKIFSFS